MSIKNNKNYYKNNMQIKKKNYGKVTNLLFNFYDLEKLYRKGFKLDKVPDENCQTIAEHVAAVSNLALVTILEYDLKLDVNKVMQMIAVHEYGEIIIGDITPFDNITAEEKYQAEKEAFKDIVKELKENKYLYNLWEEFEKKETDEAKFAYDMDKLEAALNALRYMDNLDNVDKENLKNFYPFTLDLLYFNESKEILVNAWECN